MKLKFVVVLYYLHYSVLVAYIYLKFLKACRVHKRERGDMNGTQ